MAEVFVVKNKTLGTIYLNDFGVNIPAGESVDLERLDAAILSLELASNLSSGLLVRVINSVEIPYSASSFNGEHMHPDSINTVSGFMSAIDQTRIKNLESTGLRKGGKITINTDVHKVDIAAGWGVVIDNNTDPLNPARYIVTWGAMPGVDPTYLATQPATYLAIDRTGALVQMASQLTAEQLRDYVQLGAAIHSHNIVVEQVVNAAVPAIDTALQAYDFMMSFGAFNINGNEYGPNGANLHIDKASGRTFSPGIAFMDNPKSPNINIDAPLTALTLSYSWRNGSGGWVSGSPTTSIDPDQYDDGVTPLASVPVGKFSIQMIFYVPQTQITVIGYGQRYYDSLDEAQSDLLRAVELNPYFIGTTGCIFRGWLIAKRGTTELNDVAKAAFWPAGKLGLTAVVTASGTGEDNTASNIGIGGIGLYLQKLGVDLQFKNIKGGSSKVSVADDSPNKAVAIDVAEANIIHQNISGHGTNDHGAIDSHIASTSNPHSTTASQVGAPPTTRQITAGNGLSGGGDLSTDRSLAANYETVSVPQPIGTPALGSSPTLPRSDHVHGHGNQGGDAQHSVVIQNPGGHAGFMSADDKAKLNGLPTTAPPTSRKVDTINGLQGGGDLTGDRTLSPVYGSTVNTVCQGNDARLSDARTPTLHQIGGGQHSADTIANLKTKVSDGSLFTTAPAEINAQTLKAAPAVADLLLVEDSAAAFGKKKITIGSLPANIFGGNQQNASSEAASTTTSTSLQTKLSMVTPALTGTYMVQVFAEIYNSGGALSSNRTEAQLYNSTDATELCFSSPRSGQGTYVPFSGFAIVTFTGVAKTFQVRYRTTAGSSTAYIRRARIILFRVA